MTHGGITVLKVRLVPSRMTSEIKDLNPRKRHIVSGQVFNLMINIDYKYIFATS